MRVLVYKRTHKGDPDETGSFGCYCCMGRIRGWQFDAVIGVGGVSYSPVSKGIDRKINWIGIGPHIIGKADDGHPILAFEKFRLWEERGTLLGSLAPKLAKKLYSGYGKRFLMLDDSDAEVKKILDLARRARSSKSLISNSKTGSKGICKSGKVIQH